MLNSRVFGASLIALAVAAGGALAADIPQTPYAPPPDVTYDPAPVWSWTGFYAGAAAGYGWGSFDTDSGNFGDPDADGFLGGVFTGYNFQFDNGVVLGVEGDVTYHDQKGDGIAAGTEIGTDWNGTLRGRLGYAIDRFMIYGTGGLAVGNVEAEDTTSSDSATAVGWTAGAGVEAALTDNVFARVEYRYTDLGSDSYSLDSGGVGSDFTSHGALVGLGVKF